MEIQSDVLDRAQRYHALLQAWGGKMDLTSVLDPEEAAEKHFLDSWLGSRFFPPNSTVVDAGSGAGFPGLALALLRPDLVILSIESRKKRCVFQRQVIRELGLEKCQVLEGRIQEVDLGDRADVATARALKPMSELIPLLAPLIHPGGRLVLYKGPGAGEEWAAAKGQAGGWEKTQGESFELPFSKVSREIWVLVPRGTT